MYIQGNPQYEYHVKIYGHPTKIGFKDLIPTWEADRFDPEHLLGLYKKAGAKYFCSMGVHHDGFDLWDSKYQPHWNAVATGPKRDIVGAFKQAAAKHDLRFAISEHLAPSYHWFSTSHMSDTAGPLAGAPYDGADPAFADLYHKLPKYYPYNCGLLNDRQAPTWWKQHYFNRIKDLVDKYQPDLLYSDGDIFFEEYGLALVQRQCQPPWRPLRGRLYQQAAQRLRGRNVYSGLGARRRKRHSGEPVANRLLHWQLALRSGSSL
jgi:alpha-L-fucosidase